MQWNMLADGLAWDGFLMPPASRDWPVAADMMPTDQGESVPMQQLLDEAPTTRTNTLLPPPADPNRYPRCCR